MPTPLPVHLLHPPDAPHLAYLRDRLASNVTLTTGASVPDETRILVAGRPQRDHFTPNLTALVIPFAGLPAEARALLSDHPQVSVHNLHHNAPMTAEMAITLLLTAARGIIPADRALRAYDWTPRYQPQPSVTLDGRTALVLGYGAVGQRIAVTLRALGMRVLATRRSLTAPHDDGIAQVHPAAALPDLLPQAHALLIALPDTPDTTGLIDRAAIRRLPRGALLVNVGRAAIVEQGALYDALCERHLHAAGLDVWYRYPRSEAAWTDTPPADYPFGALNNVVLSPHRGGGGGQDEVEERRMAALADSLNAAARGEAIPHRIDLLRGY